MLPRVLFPVTVELALLLLARLESDPQFTYTVLYGQYDSGLLKVYKKKKDKDGSQPREEVDHNEMSWNPQDGDTVQTYADKVRDSLSITGSSCILLAVAWTTNTAQRLLELFPEFQCTDVTMGTNAERRPLIISCGKDGNNEAFSHTWAFLPSQSRWVFQWYFSYAFPALHRPSVLGRNRIHLTDQDPQEVGALLESQRLWFKKAKQRICSFHKVDRNFVSSSEYKSIIAKNDEKPTRAIELRMIVSWMYMFIKDYETKTEAD